MRSTFLARTRKWIGASALALLVGLGGGSAFLAASSPMAAAQVVPAAQITSPAINPANGFADLVDLVKPAVVSIVVEGRDTSQNQLDLQFNQQMPDLPEDNPFKRFFDQFGPGAGPGPNGRPDKPQRPQGRKFVAAGSGFVISNDGYIVTNNHVVKNANKVTVIFDDGTSKTAKVVGTDEGTDLAVVKVDGVTDIPSVRFASDNPRVGDWVIAVGNPFGLGGSVTAGIVSALGRDVDGSAYGNFIQIDAAINMGNSGGPAFNLKGEVVGVNTEIFSPNGGNVGIAFAIPAKTVEQITSSLIKTGTVTRGFLNVKIQDVSQDIADNVGLKEAKGALVTEVAPDSPGGKAGLKSGDIIQMVNDQKIDDSLSLKRTISSTAPGSSVQLTVWRDGKAITLTATLGTLEPAKPDQPSTPTPPNDQQAGPVDTSVGLTLVPNSAGDGVLVQNVDPDSVAAEYGFRVGDAILEVENKKVTNGQEFEDVIKATKASGKGTALIKAQRDGSVMFVAIKLTATNG